MDTRHALTPFRTDSVKNIPGFLDSHLPPEELETLINEGIDIIAGAEGINEKRAKAYDRIQAVQSDLLGKLQVTRK